MLAMERANVFNLHSYSSDAKRTNLILTCVGFLAKSFSQRYTLHINFLIQIAKWI